MFNAKNLINPLWLWVNYKLLYISYLILISSQDVLAHLDQSRQLLTMWNDGGHIDWAISTLVQARDGENRITYQSGLAMSVGRQVECKSAIVLGDMSVPIG